MDTCKILILEDEAISGLATASVLRKRGYAVTAVITSGDDAVRKAFLEEPDLLISDIRLGGFADGIDAVRRLRMVRPGLPVIYLTGFGDHVTRSRASGTSPVAFLTKPFRETDLLSAVVSAVGAPPRKTTGA